MVRSLLVAISESSNQLELVVRRAVSLGGDTDTIASIAGQVAGAAGGELPTGLMSRIPRIADAESTIDAFIAQAVPASI